MVKVSESGAFIPQTTPNQYELESEMQMISRPYSWIYAHQSGYSCEDVIWGDAGRR